MKSQLALNRLMTLVILLSLFLVMRPLIANAAYLEDVPIDLTQPDGQEIQCYATGDEYYNWLHDKTHYTIVKNQRTEFYVYALLVKNSLVPSDLIVGRADPVQAGLTPNLNISPTQMQQLRSSSLMSIQSNPTVIQPAPRSGMIENLVIFIRFKGETEFTDMISNYDRSFNSSTSGAISVRNYFQEVSYGALEVNSYFYPDTPAATVVSYQDSHVRGYYKPITDDPQGYINDYQRAQREQVLIKNALEFIRSQIPTALHLDGDNDGFIDNIVFIIAGNATAWNTILWPHAWSLYMYTVIINGVEVNGYNVQVQSFLTGGQIQLICHEMLHSIGFPDLYHYTSNGIAPVAGWDIMATPISPPQHPCVYSKLEYGDWLDTMPVIDRNGNFTLNPLTSASNNCYKILSPNDPSGQQYFVLEYRRKKKVSFDSNLSGEGLLIYRIDNRDPRHHGNATLPDEIYLYRPGGTLKENGTPNQAQFSVESNRTVFNDSSNPSCFLIDGSPGGLDIFNISRLDSTISFSIGFSTPDAPLLAAPMDHSFGVMIDPNLSWSAAPGASSYHLQISSSTTFNNMTYESSGLLTTFKQVSGLSVGKNYCWRVRAKNLKGTSNWSKTWDFTVGHVVPLSPTLAAPGNGSTDVAIDATLTWNSVANANSYHLQVSSAGDFHTTVFDQDGLVNTMHDISGLLDNSVYYWRVGAANMSAVSDWSQTWHFTTVNLPPAAPKGIAVQLYVEHPDQ